MGSSQPISNPTHRLPKTLTGWYYPALAQMPGWRRVSGSFRWSWRRVPASADMSLWVPELQGGLDSGCGLGQPFRQNPRRNPQEAGPGRQLGCASACKGTSGPISWEPDPALGFLEWVCPRFRPRRGWRDPTLPGLPPARLLSTRREDSSWAWCFEVQTADAGACDPTANALQSPRGRIWKPGRRGDGALSSR